ncbi:hypothetical protein HanRHA438_Chr14g0641361 [Helianthus annuus]|nr:hypothetical protein HanRHA438_Chr14g0641361 [Helianthus annuus]
MPCLVYSLGAFFTMCCLKQLPFYLLCFPLLSFGLLTYMPFLRLTQYTLGGFEDTLTTQSK